MFVSQLLLDVFLVLGLQEELLQFIPKEELVGIHLKLSAILLVSYMIDRSHS